LTGRAPLFYAAVALDVSTVMDLESLKLLEARIDQFVSEHERVRDAHETLQERLKDKEQQLAEVTARLQQYEHERTEIRTRLERILSRLEGVDLT
jgi:septal ring factor EnvC (AmiA/AmiB activator)